MPSEAHEVVIRLMDWMISTRCEELALNLKTTAATTLQRLMAACQQNGELVAKQQFRTWVRQRIAPQ